MFSGPNRRAAARWWSQEISILWTIGIILLVIGVVLFILGAIGREVGGRKYWY